MDKIYISDLKVFAYHGVNREEKRDGQNFYLDLELSLDVSKACRSDDLNDTVSYAKIIKTAIRVMTADKYDLLEYAAQTVVDAIFEEYDEIKAVKIKLKKPEAPIKADFGYVAVELERTR